MYDPRWDDFAIALKTGSEVALQRVPIQLVTFLSDVRNKIIIGDGPNITVGDYEMIDVYTNLYNDSSSSLNKRATETEVEMVQVNTSSMGWKTDAHKNLPGFKILNETFPSAKWYIMMDDDTYLFKHNLAYILKDYNHTNEHYFGMGSAFRGCDGVTNYDDGPKFAQGGAGIVISSGAMKSISKVLDKCIIKYRDCFAGDVRTGLCLRDAGILLESMPEFNKDPPQTMRSVPACQKPISYHHLLVKQIQELWDIESRYGSIRGRLVTFAELYGKLIGKQKDEEMMVNIDMPGNDIGSLKIADASTCQITCKNDPICVSFSFVDGECWLKNSINYSKTVNGTFSGVFQEKYKCTE